MSSTEFMSKEGFEKLQEDLKFLKAKERPRIARAIQEAREKGDLSENAEYDAAKDEQGHLEARIAMLEDKVANSKVVDLSSLSTDKVMILTTVKVLNHNSNKEVRYKLVAESEANFKEGKISIKSPIAQALVGGVIGDVVEATVPAGKIKLEILDITLE